VESLHWLILIPFYFFGSITLLLSFILAARVSRLRVSVDPLVPGACALAVALIVVPLLAGWVTLDAYGGRVLVVLIVASFTLAGLDALLQPLVPLPLDEELRESEPGSRDGPRASNRSNRPVRDARRVECTTRSSRPDSVIRRVRVPVITAERSPPRRWTSSCMRGRGS